ncbi:Hypothetical protein D9617_5g069260 [Elsinoe fawcettii]|nr:Hypothetical protein D9617_5g069260 [Elsinoe fawcettii]
MDDNQHLLIANIVCWVSTYITFSLRLYVRAVKLHTFGIDDWLMLATQACFTLYLSGQAYGLSHGLGKPISHLSLHDTIEARRGWFIAALAYEPATVLLKLSAGFFILKFTTAPVHRWILHLTAGACILIGAFFWFILLLQCRPVPFFWRLPDHGEQGECIPIRMFLICGTVGAVLNAFADLVYALLPIHMVYTSTWTRWTKVTVCVLLGFGSVAGVATFVRLAYKDGVKEVYEREGEFLLRSTVFTVWTNVEVGLGITAACTATLRPLWDRRRSVQLQSEPTFGTMAVVGDSGVGVSGGTVQDSGIPVQRSESVVGNVVSIGHGKEEVVATTLAVRTTSI